MKKVLKFLCLVIIAALIAILVLKNGAKAEGSLQSASFSENVTVGQNCSLILTFDK